MNVQAKELNDGRKTQIQIPWTFELFGWRQNQSLIFELIRKVQQLIA